MDLPVATVLRVVAIVGCTGGGGDRRGDGCGVAFAGAVVVSAECGKRRRHDPIFGRPLDFYLFHIACIGRCWSSWLMTLGIISCVIAGVFMLISGGARALSGRLSSVVPLPWRGLSATGGFLLLVLAARVYMRPLRDDV